MRLAISFRVQIIFLAFSQLISPYSLAIKLDEAILEQIAEEQGYGYKFANLKLLKELAREFNDGNHTYKIAIPKFKGIPSSNVQSFLRAHGLDAAHEWKQIVERHFSTQDEQAQAFYTKKFTPSFLKDVAVLEQSVRDTFARASLEENLRINSEFNVTGVDELIAQIAQSQEKLMVRSTGKEDTRKLANAGGNVSKANVSPEEKAVLSSISDVVASYFGQKSLTQRLGAKDASLFDKTVFTPVLLQRMIGEKDNELPKCGVMFTEETEGGISKLEHKDTHGNVITSGITVIQAAYGHNEGVVNSLIPVDTFYVDSAKHIYPIIRTKTFRVVPAGEGELRLQRNSENIVRESSLSKSAVSTLKAFATALENYYGWPMDAEFVVKEHERTIYIVQARPITHSKEHQDSPSYLLNIDNIASDQKLLGSAIGVAGGALREIHRSDEIIVRDDIGKALASYQDEKEVPNPQSIKTVIVGQMAPATSHEATTFRGESKPVVQIETWRTVDEWVKHANSLVVSPQQGLVVQGELSHLEKTEGWADYPVPGYVSLNHAFTPIKDVNLMAKAFERRARESVASPAFDEMLIRLHNDFSLRQPVQGIRFLFDRMKFGDHAEAAAATALMIHKIVDWISKRSQNEKELDKASQRYLALLASYGVGFGYNILQVLSFAPKSNDFTKRLLPIHFLESLFWQELQPDIVDNVSVASFVLHWLGEEQKIRNEQSDSGSTLGLVTTKLALAKNLAVTPELGNSWVQFLSDMKKSDRKSQDDFGKLFFELSSLDALPVWLNTSFAKKIAQNDKPREAIIREFVDEYRSQRLFLQELSHYKAVLAAFNVSTFDDPKNFASQWQLLTKDLLDYFSGKNFTTQFTQANDFGRLAALGIMGELVDSFDRSIKAITGSSQYKKTPVVQLKNVHTMLLRYRSLFYAWIDNTVNPKSIKYNRTAGSETTLKDYKRVIDSVLDKAVSVDKSMLVAHNEFNAGAVTIGNGTYLGEDRIRLPQTYEEVFMMIHQCLLATLQVLNKDSGIADIPRPKLLKAVENKLSELNSDGAKPSLVGVNLKRDTISLLYNLPLYFHSMQYELRYDKTHKPERVVAEFRFFGQDTGNRWSVIERFLDDLSALDLDLPFVKHTNSGITFQVLVKSEAQLSPLLIAIQGCADETIDPGKLDGALKVLFAGKRDLIVARISARILAPKFDSLEYEERSDLFKSLSGLVPEYGIKSEETAKALTDVAAKGITDKDNSIKRTARDLMVGLVKTNFQYALEKAAAIALDGNGRLTSFVILNELVKQKHQPSIAQATEAANQDIKSSSYQVRAEGISIFRILVTNGLALESATRAASLFTDPAESVSSEALGLYSALLENKYAPAFAEAIHNASIACESQSNGIKIAGFRLFTALVKAEYLEASTAAKDAVKKNLLNSDLTQAREELIYALKMKPQEIAREAASEYVKSAEPGDIASGLQLYAQLVNASDLVSFEPALLAAKNALTVKPDQSSAALKVFLALVRKDRTALPEAISIARDLIASPEQEAKDNGLGFLASLLDFGYKEAVEGAEKAIQENPNWKSKSMERLKRNLLLLKKKMERK